MSASDWVLVLLPLVLVAVGTVLLLRGRAALREAQRITGGFGGPPGSMDVGTQVGFGVDPQEHRTEVLAARRQQLWGGVLLGVGLLVLAIVLLVRVL